jgi:hypothetical protein
VLELFLAEALDHFQDAVLRASYTQAANHVQDF